MSIDPLIPPPQFQQSLAAMGIELDPGDDARLGRYLAMLLEANKAFNLTAITDPDAAWVRHIADALTLIPLLAAIEVPGGAETGLGGATGALRVIDIGSGGGLPGIPLAICVPDAQFTLVDSTGKKAAFLRSVVAELGLKNVVVINDRAEVLGQAREHRERYDCAIARAVGGLAILVEFLLPLVRVGGVALAIKGARADDELAAAGKAIALLGGEHDQTHDTPTGRVVVIGKARATPRAYPRRVGEPASKPLGT